MSNPKQPPQIDVEMYYHSEDPSSIGFNIQTLDGTPLTGQMIIDAIADCLMEHYDYRVADKGDPRLQ